MTIILTTIIGSHAHGLARPDSDIDAYTVYTAKPKSFFDIYPNQKPTTHRIYEGLDSTYIELREFCQQCLKGNPNSLEILYATPSAVMHPYGQILVNNREAFLSKRLKNSYKGMVSEYVYNYHKTGKKKYHDGAIYYYLAFKDVWEDQFLVPYKPELPDIAIDSLISDMEGETDLPDEPDFSSIQDIVYRIRQNEM